MYTFLWGGGQCVNCEGEGREWAKKIVATSATKVCTPVHGNIVSFI